MNKLPAVSRRILLLITDLEIGGTPSVVRELAIRLNSPEVRVDVACLGGWGPVAELIKAAGIRVTALGARGAWDVGAIWKLHRLVAAGGYDTLVSFLIHANTAAAVMKIIHPKLRCIQSIQTTQPEPGWHWGLQGYVQQWADAVLVPSESVARVAEARSGVEAEKIAVIPNAVEPGEFMQSTRSPTQIGFIGRLDPIKQVPLLVRQFAGLAAMRTNRRHTALPSEISNFKFEIADAPTLILSRSTSGGDGTRPTPTGEPDDVHLHIFGQGPERGNIEAEISRLGLNDRLTLHGAIAKPQEALRQIGLLVLPSSAEGFGLVLIEAMAAGVPVVANRAPGICDVVEDGQTGLLVDVQSSDALAMAMERIIDDAVLRAQLIENGRGAVERRFSWGVVLPVYKRLLGLDAPPAH